MSTSGSGERGGYHLAEGIPGFSARGRIEINRQTWIQRVSEVVILRRSMVVISLRFLDNLLSGIAILAVQFMIVIPADSSPFPGLVVLHAFICLTYERN